MADAPRVLVVDDATLIRLYYRQALEPSGVRVEEAINGIEALEKVLASPPDLLVVDVNMPKMDGIAFVRSLRRLDGPAASIPVLMTSTEAGEQDRAMARAAGANFYLVKPVSPEALALHAAALIGRRP